MDEKDNPIEGDNLENAVAVEGEEVTLADDNSESAATAEEVVRDPAEQIAELELQLKTERDRYVRSVADLDNMRKRCRRDVDEALSRGRIQVVEECLPAMDSIDMALRSVEASAENQAIFDGLAMVKRQFTSSLEKFGLKTLSAMNQPFDPAIHEAIGHVPSEDVPSGAVMQELRSGYTLGERLVRAAMVIVSSGPPAKPAGEVEAIAEEIVSPGEADAEKIDAAGETPSTPESTGE